MEHDDPQTRTSDPSRHPGRPSTSTPPRGRDANAPEDPEASGEITRTAGLWVLFPVLCVVVLTIVLILIFT